MSSARQKSSKKKQIDPFMLMGTSFKDLDESRFMKGTKSHKVAVERLNNRAAHVPQPTPPASDGEDESDTQSHVSSGGNLSLFISTPPRPARIIQLVTPPVGISTTIVSHQHRQKTNTRVLQQPSISTVATGLSTPPISDRKKVVRMVRTSTGAIVKKEIEITAPIKVTSHRHPIPAPNFGFRTSPVASQKEEITGPKAAEIIKEESESDDDYVHLRAPSQTSGNSKQRNPKIQGDQDDLNNPFKVFQPVMPDLSPFVKRKPETTPVPVKHDRVTPTFSTDMSLKTEGRTAEGTAQTFLQRNIPTDGVTTPETTPTKRAIAKPGSTSGLHTHQISRVINGNELISRLSPNDPFQKKPANQHGPFSCLLAKPVRLLRLSTRISGKEVPLPVYAADNGDILGWYQAFDVEHLVAESVAREIMRLQKDDLLYDVPHGRILAYEMGMGKTHVALSVVAETFSQIAALHKLRKTKFARKPVLIVADKSLQSQWEKHATSLFGLKVVIYSENRHAIPSDVDVIIVNIFLLRNQHKQKLEDECNQDRKARQQPFFQTAFSYLIVDEFHQYSNPSTLGACALLNVKADNVLLLSGTPAQNKLDDLQLPLALLQHPARRKEFREIERALRKAKNERALKAFHIVDNHNVNDKTLIDQTFITRRIVDGPDGIHTLYLPPRINNVVKIELTPAEYHLHEHVYARETGFVRFLRCRQASIDPRLLISSGALDATFEPEIGSKDIEDVTDEFDTVMADVGDHTHEKPPSYDIAAKAALLEFREELQDDYLPSKTRVALQLLRSFRNKGEKALIFSNFTTLLYRLSESLDAHGIGHTHYHGRMDRNQRDRALLTLANDNECSVLLVSIKAGGLGLNITAANNVIIMDPWWNPYMEEQAIARVYRIGQTRQVEVFRLISPGTVEERVVMTQEQKTREIGDFLDKTALITKERDTLRHSMF